MVVGAGRGPEVTLATGAVMRRTGPPDGLPVLMVNGGTARPLPGTWSASLEWLVERLARELPALAFCELRYRIKSWRLLGMAIEDGRAAIAAAADGRPAAVVGFSMGGAVAIAIADHPDVRAVIGLAPWIPDQLSVDGLEGRRFSVVQGSLDGVLPIIPGVSPRSSRRGFARIQAAGVPGEYTLLRGAVHQIAYRGAREMTMPSIRAGAWARAVEDELRRFADRAAAADG